MGNGICQEERCTFAETGICLHSHNPPESCPHLEKSATANAATAQVTSDAELPVVGTTVSAMLGRTFHSGLEFGSQDALEISRSRYCHLIPTLGASNAGKTCFLLSLYLMACRNRFPAGYQFAGSLTLKGFEDRARHLRLWKGGSLPEKLADHTVLGDSREAALLHLAIRKNGDDARRLDLLLTDLPGEWSTTLIDRKSSAERLRFLQRADGLIVVIDGPALAGSTRHVELARSKHLLERLRTDVGVDVRIPTVILISKGDEIAMKLPSAAADLANHAKTLGYNARVIVAAAFSHDSSIANGTGVFETVEAMIAPAPTTPLAPMIPVAHNARKFAAYTRRDRA